MVDRLAPMIDAPIAGQSLTAELGNRPWQQPPQYTTVEEALQFYIPRLTNPDMLDDLLNVMETGVPLTTLANAIQSSGVMEGKHSLDIGILIMPVLMETMAYLAEESGVEFESGTNKKIGSDKPSDALVASAVKMAEKTIDKRKNKPKEEEQIEMELEEPSVGLMSRRNTDGV
jgi:hypothetical protein